MNTTRIWKSLFTLLGLSFLTFAILALILNFSSSGMSLAVYVTLTQISAFAFFAALFFAQVIALFFFATLVFIALRTCGSYFLTPRHKDEAPRPPRLISVVAASVVVALFFNQAVRVVLETLMNVLRYVFGVLPGSVLADIDRILDCIAKETAEVSLAASGPVIEGSPVRDCVATLVREERSIVGDAIYGFGDGSGQITADLPQILLAFVVFAAVLRIAELQSETATRITKFWTAYAVMAIAAIYLSLSATLSVSLLLETGARTSTLTGELLETRIKGFVPEKPVYDFSASDNLAPLNIVGDTTRIALLVNAQQIDADTARTRAQDMVNDLPTFVTAIIGQARTRFSLIEAENFNSREQALYFQDLTLWAQASFSEYLAHIHRCNIAHRSKLLAFRLGGAVYESILATPPGAASQLLSDQVDTFEGEVRKSDTLINDCVNTSAAVEPPEQRQLGSTLGPIGKATGWLLQAQSLPLTLVIGLVGYGLLGALISRFVIAKEDEFRIDDTIEFAVVTLAGFVAALVVFVSSFGGMYVLAREATEPNPYAVFALCLGGAIFSSSVWTNLRTKLGAAASQAEMAAAADSADAQNKV